MVSVMTENKDFLKAKEIAREIAKKGGKTFLVGGALRDFLRNEETGLGAAIKDVDLEIHDITPAKLRDVLEGFGVVDVIGEQFGILNLHGWDIDFAQPRLEKAVGNKHTDLDVIVDPFLPLEKAAARRDFTFNAFMMDILDDENNIIDFFGGKEDLANGIVRHVDARTFAEDPLRPLRAARFAAVLGFRIADETIELARGINLTVLPKERVWGEVKKVLLKAEKPAIFFEELDRMGKLGELFPELEALKAVPQNPAFHPEGDAFKHTMLVVNTAAMLRKHAVNPEGFMLAAMAHDFGKAIATMADENGVIRAIGHETMGLPLVEAFMDRVVGEVKLKKFVMNLTELHMIPNHAFANKAKVKTTNKLFDKAIVPNDLLLLAEADHMGRLNPTDFADAKAWLWDRLARFEALKETPEVLGRDLVKAGLKPGRHFTVALDLAHKLFLAEVPFDKALPQVVALARKEERKA